VFFWSWGFAGMLLGWVALSAYRQAEDSGFGLSGLSDEFCVFFKIIAIILIAAALCALAIANDALSLPKFALAVKAAITGYRFESLVAGLVAGILTRSFFSHLRRSFDRLFSASSWGPAVMFGALLLIALLLTFKPDILGSIESFKVGGVEAKFVQKSSNIVQAHVNLNVVDRKLTLDHWKDFDTFYLTPDNPRTKVIEWFDETQPEEKDEGRKLIELIWWKYMKPVIDSMSCMEENESLERARLDYNYQRLATTWQNFMIKLDDTRIDISQGLIEKVLSESDKYIDNIVSDARGVDARCIDKDKPSPDGELFRREHREPSNDAKIIWLALEQTIARIRTDPKEKEKDNREIYALTLLDPYIAGAVGDLIGFNFGQREKARFLMQISRKYTTNGKLPLPGIINIYWQLSEAKLHSEAAWPLDDAIGDVEHALQGADDIIYRTRMHAKEKPEDQISAGKIIDSYLFNRFFFLSRTLEFYNQRALSGEHISESHRQKWAGALSQLIAINYARSKAFTQTLDDISAAKIDPDVATRWSGIRISDNFAEQEFFGDLAFSLSVILRNEDGIKPSATACATAQYYINTASEIIPILVERGDLKEGDHAIVRQYALSVADRVKASCP
jgi:hypothetical protein